MKLSTRRYQLILGKFPIVEIHGTIAVLSIQDKLFLRIPIPSGADVRVGDLLSVYTEVLAKAN